MKRPTGIRVNELRHSNSRQRIGFTYTRGPPLGLPPPASALLLGTKPITSSVLGGSDPLQQFARPESDVFLVRSTGLVEMDWGSIGGPFS